MKSVGIVTLLSVGAISAAPVNRAANSTHQPMVAPVECASADDKIRVEISAGMRNESARRRAAEERCR